MAAASAEPLAIHRESPPELIGFRFRPATLSMSELLVFCTCPDADSARRIADGLVEQHLAACVNILPGVTSVYRWKGEVHHDQELLLMVKTRRERLDELKVHVVMQHPHELPEIIAVEIAAGLDAYLSWIRAQTLAITE